MDELARIREMGVAIDQHEQATRALSAERAELLRAKRAEGWSFGQLADETGLSKTRIAQICGGTVQGD